MTGIRRVSQLGTTGESTYVDGSIQAVDIAANVITQDKLSMDVPLSGMRNFIINGGMDVWQRGTSFTNPASGGYTADRMFVVYDGSGATRTISQGQFDPYLSGASITATPPTGTSPNYFLRWNQSVAGTGGNYNILYANRVENVRLLAGKTVTLSFYAKAGASLTMPLIDIEQSFGSGGSPSTSVYSTAANAYTVTTSWQRFTYTFTIPSAAGKVIGTDVNSSYTSIRLWVPLNTTFVLDLWGIQLETGSQATPFEQRPIGTELALCQRYYEKFSATSIYTVYGSGLAGAVDSGTITMPFRVTKRVQPTSLDITGSCIMGDGINNYTIYTLQLWTVSSPFAGGVLFTTPSSLTTGKAYSMFSNNNTTSAIAFSSEL